MIRIEESKVVLDRGFILKMS